MASATAAVTAKARENKESNDETEKNMEDTTGTGELTAPELPGKTNVNAAKIAASGGSGGTGAHSHGMPFKMKAGDHGNSPIEKNYGTPMNRGFGTGNLKGGVQGKGIENQDDGPGSGLNKGVAAGSSPNKFFGKLKARAKKMLGINKGGAAAGIVKNQAAAGAPVEGGGDGGAVAPHGDEAHTGGAIGGGADAGGAGGDVFNVGNAISGMEGLDQAGMKEYMGGFDEDQTMRIRKQQGKDKMKNMMGGNSMWGGANSSGGFGNMLSDIRLKENITRTGTSKSGIPTYEFNYIGDNNRWSGAMAQDLLNTEHVTIHESGFYMVDYNNIDVEMKLV